MECPICKARMQLKTIEGVHVDICEQHGVWLDKGELEALTRLSERRGHSEDFTRILYSNFI